MCDKVKALVRFFKQSVVAADVQKIQREKTDPEYSDKIEFNVFYT